MACFVPLKNTRLDILLFALRPTVVLVGELLESLKHFSLWSKTLGCLCSSIFQSIHGNMILCYGAWKKRPEDDMEILIAALLSRLTKTVAGMAILFDHSILEAYAGESRDSSIAAKLYAGDTISISAAFFEAHDLGDGISYACLALFETHFLQNKGASAGVCLRSKIQPRVMCLLVWKSRHSCYSWIINFSHRSAVLPYVNDCSIDIKYDVFRVVYVDSDIAQNFHQFFAPHYMLENGEERDPAEGPIMQDVI